MKLINNHPVTILAIDDELVVLERIAAVLEKAGYRCQCARDAASAQQAVECARPDLIISEVNLVGQSGATICQQLKERAGLGDVPVMFLSEGQVPDIIRRSHAEGGTYYLRKPFVDSVLLQLIEKTRTMICESTTILPAPTIVVRPSIGGELPKPVAIRVATRAAALATQ